MVDIADAAEIITALIVVIDILICSTLYFQVQAQLLKRQAKHKACQLT